MKTEHHYSIQTAGRKEKQSEENVHMFYQRIRSPYFRSSSSDNGWPAYAPLYPSPCTCAGGPILSTNEGHQNSAILTPLLYVVNFSSVLISFHCLNLWNNVSLLDPSSTPFLTVLYTRFLKRDVCPFYHLVFSSYVFPSVPITPSKQLSIRVPPMT